MAKTFVNEHAVKAVDLALTSGKPRNEQENRHSFREWAQTLDWIVQNLFGAAPLIEGDDTFSLRISQEDQPRVRVLLNAHNQGSEIGVR